VNVKILINKVINYFEILLITSICTAVKGILVLRSFFQGV